MPRRVPLREARRPHVALLVETSLGSGRDILRGIARYVREHGGWSLYHEPRSLEESAPRWLPGWDGDGIIARIQNGRIARQVQASGIPTVDVLGVVADLPFPLVHVDDSAIAALAAEHLLERGFRKFGYFGIQGENWSERRRDAFMAAVAAAGCEAKACELPRRSPESSSWETMEDALACWVKGLPKPTGVMVCSDQRGALFLEACRRAGAAVPDEVAVVGVDNDEALCDVCNPPLSSVDPGHERVGFEAAAVLDRMMRGGAAPREPLLVPPRCIVARSSTEVSAIDDRQLAAALRLIREHAASGLKVEQIAREVGLSRSVLQRRFRSVLRRSVHGEILNTRMRRARELLTGSDLSLAEVAERAGFRHQEYLGAVFKARLGKTPLEVRRESRSA